MNELYFLDGDLSPCGVADRYSRLVWDRQYYACGSFSLSLPLGYGDLPAGVRYLFNPEEKSLGRIGQCVYRAGDGSRAPELTLSGSLSEGLLGHRVLDRYEHLEGNLETALRTLIRTYAMTGDRAIPHLALDTALGLTETVSAQAFGTDLSAYLYTLLGSYGLSYAVTFDTASSRLLFSLKKGKNRTEGQSVVPPAVFSPSFGNLLESQLTFRDLSYRNYAYVLGQGEENDRFRVVLDRRAEGEERRELFCSASDISRTYIDPEGERQTFSDEDYAAFLTTRGEERLAVCRPTLTLTGLLNRSLCPAYPADFDLGDICSCRLAGESAGRDLRLVRITSVRDGGAESVRLRFTEEND